MAICSGTGIRLAILLFFLFLLENSFKVSTSTLVYATMHEHRNMHVFTLGMHITIDECIMHARNVIMNRELFFHWRDYSVSDLSIVTNCCIISKVYIDSMARITSFLEEMKRKGLRIH